MFLSRSGVELSETWHHQALLLEADERVRAAERQWQQSGSPEHGKNWARQALRAGHSPLEVGKRLFHAHPDAHKEMSDELWKQGHHMDPNQLTSHVRSTHAPFELPSHIHDYVQSVNRHDNFVAQEQKQGRQDPDHRTNFGLLHELESNKFHARRNLTNAVKNIAGYSPAQRLSDEDRENINEQTLHHALHHHPHKDDRSRVRTIADFHGGRHQHSGEIHDIREGEGAQDNIHHIDVDSQHHPRAQEGRISQSLRRHFPKSEVSATNLRLHPHHHDRTRHLEVALPKSE